MKFTQGVKTAVKQAIKNSENMSNGFYQFSDFLKDPNNNLGLNDVEMITAEYEFYYAVTVRTVTNVKFNAKANKISSIYEKY